MLETEAIQERSSDWDGYGPATLYDESYYRGYCKGRRHISTKFAISLYRSELKQSSGKENADDCPLYDDLSAEIGRFIEKYGDLPSEKLADIINQESEYLVLLLLKDSF